MTRVWTITAVVSAAMLACGCGARSADTAPLTASTLPTVSIMHPRRADATRSVTLPGDVAGWADSELYAKVTGYLRRIDVDKGDWVKKGQVLAEIEVPELEQRLERARAKLQVRRVTYERLNGVWASDHRLVAREDVDIAQGEYQQARADVDELEALVGYTKIVAPFDGVVTARYVDPGALIRASAQSEAPDGTGSGGQGKEGPVLRVADIATLRVYVYMPEAETSLVRRGQPATLTLREFPGRTFTGTVARFNTSLSLSTRTMLTEVDLDNPNHELYPGMYADVTIELMRHAGALEVPPSAVGSADDGREFVEVVRDGAIATVPVTTGIRGEGWVEVTSGLSGDESLVVNAGTGLGNGTRVRTVEAQADAGTERPHGEG
jgi:membrane fusion protein (multidrug efflux system)